MDVLIPPAWSHSSLQTVIQYFLNPKQRCIKGQYGSYHYCAHINYSQISLSPCLSKVCVAVWILAMKRSWHGTVLFHNLVKVLTWYEGEGLWVLAWRPLNISIPAIKYSIQWELESLLSLNYRSVFNCAFPLPELMQIHAEWNSLDQNNYGNFLLHFTTQDAYQQGAECGLNWFKERRDSVMFPTFWIKTVYLGSFWVFF